MKLLHIIPTYKPAYGYGGPIISIGLLCENLVSQANCDVTVAATNANVQKDLPVHWREPVLVEGVKVYYFRRITPDHSQLSPHLLWWLWRNVKTFDAVHIHSWWNLTVLFSTFVCILRGVRPVLSPRGMLSPFSLKSKFKSILHKTIGQRLLSRTFLHATSPQETAECVALIPNWQNVMLPNFLELPTVEAKQKFIKDHAMTKIRLLFLSRIHPKKGIELLFNALAQVPFDWSLSIAGDGEAAYIMKLEQLATALSIDKKITWLGWVTTIQRPFVFQAADLLVLPSHNENFANVVVESLAMGTPVLVSRHVGLSDYVVQNDLGWVCDTTVESIKETLNQAFTQSKHRQWIAERSAAQIRADFDPSVLAAKYMAVYRRVNPQFFNNLKTNVVEVLNSANYSQNKQYDSDTKYSFGKKFSTNSLE